MSKMLLGTILLGVAAGLVMTHATTLGLQAAWPFAVGLALAPLGARRRGLVRSALSVIAGVGLGVAVFVAVSEWMPFIPVSFGIAVGIAVSAMGVLAVLAPRTLSLPAMLASFAVLFGSYEAQWTANRAAFRSEAAAAAASVTLALLGGLIASLGATLLLRIEPRQRAGEVIPFRARLRVASPQPERRAAAGGGM